jgi:hypothetical protein
VRQRRRPDPARPRSIHIDTAHATPPRTAVELVEARDAAILAFLEDGPASFEAVCASLEEEPGWTNGQRAEACTLALRRLKLKNEIRKVGDSWMLPTHA